MKKKMTVPEFEEWSRQAVEWRTQAETGKLALAEYERMLKKINVPGVQVSFTWPLALSFMRKVPHIDFIRVLEYNKNILWQILHCGRAQERQICKIV